MFVLGSGLRGKDLSDISELYFPRAKHAAKAAGKDWTSLRNLAFVSMLKTLRYRR